MKKIMKRSIISLLVFTLMLPVIAQVFSIGIGWIDSVAGAETRERIPEAYSLPDSSLGEEAMDGQWRFALRESDGYAVITGHDGTASEISVPTTLNGVDVVGVASGAFDTAIIKRITFHGNVMWIAEDVLGDNTPEIIAPNGAYALYYADTHGLKWQSNSEYTLVPGVIDYSEVPSSRIKRRGDSYVWLNSLEGSRLSEGCYFHMKDARSSAYFYQVSALENADGGVLATVQEPDLGNVIIDAHISETIVITQEDCVPAEGIIMNSNASGKARSTSVEQKGIDFTFDPSMDCSKYLSGHFSAKTSASFNVNVAISTTYTLDIVDQVVTYAESKEETSVKVTFSLTDSLSGSVKTNKLKDADSKYNFTVPMGHIQFSNGIIGVKVKPSFVATLSGSISASYTHTSVTDKVYDFTSQEWVVKYDNSNGSQNKDAISFSGTISGKVGVKLPITVTLFCVIKAAEIDVEGGVKISFTVTASTDPNAVPCYIATFDVYCSLNVYAGAWVGGEKSNGNGKNGITIGAKFNILSKEFLLSEWMQKDPLKIHILPLEYWDDQPDFMRYHIPDRCPFGDRLTVSFDTMTSRQIQPIKVFRGKPVPALDGYRLPDSDQYGKFKGWSTKPGSLQADWVLGDENYPVQESMKLYAVWSNTALVHFDSQGGTAVEDQHVPVGGYAEQPKDPENNGKAFQYWYTLDTQGHACNWDFNKNTVPTNGITLYAFYFGEAELVGGTTESIYIGDPNEVGNDYIPDVDSFNEYARWADYFEYQIDSITLEKKTITYLTITGLKNDPVNLVVPVELFVQNGLVYEYMPVTGITSGAFRNCTSLKSVSFEYRDDDWEESIASCFEGCTSLEYVDLSNIKLRDGVVSAKAFSGCTALKCVRLPAGIHTIGENAFSNCVSLSTLTIKKGIYTLDPCAFSGCSGLLSLNIEEGLESIQYGVFRNCKGLTEIVLPDSLEELYCADGEYTRTENGVFYGCSNVRRISVGGINIVKRWMLDTGAPIEELEIRGTVKEIGGGAFYSSVYFYTSLFDDSIDAKLIIRDGVERIGNHAFYNCYGLTSVSMPDSISSIGDYAFSGCNRITAMRLSNDLVEIGEGAFENCSNWEASVDIPGVVEEIKASTFSGCEKLTAIKINEGIKSIGARAFNGCSGLTEIVLPDSLEELYCADGEYTRTENGVFYGCSNVRRISVGGINIVKRWMLDTGAPIEELEIRGTVKEIGGGAFYSSVYFYTSLFDDSIDAKLIIRDGVERIGNHAFYNCYGLTSVSMPDSISSIGDYAFSGCNRITTMRLSNDLVEIGEGAFENCSNWEASVDIPGVVEEIKASTFSGCEKLTAIKINEGIKSIGARAFNGCSGLTEIVLPDSIRNIYIMDNDSYLSTYGVFYGCSNVRRISVGGIDEVKRYMFYTGSPIEELEIRGTVKEIGDGAFYSSAYFYTSLYDDSIDAKLIIRDGVERIGNHAFYNCYGLTSVSMPDSISSIGDYAFSGCNRITTMRLSNDLVEIGEGAFENCSNWEASVDIPGVVEEIKASTFSGCEKLTAIKINEGIKSIGARAFNGCSGLTEIVLPDSLEDLYCSRDTRTSSPFYGCGNLKRLSVGGIEEVKMNMLYTGISLDELEIRGTVKRIGDNALYDQGYDRNNTGKKLIIQEGVQSIGKGAFQSCSDFSEIMIPDSVTSIDASAFEYCHSIRIMRLSTGLTSIHSTAFNGCTPGIVKLRTSNEYVEDYLTARNIPYEIEGKTYYSVNLDANGGSFDDKALNRTFMVAWGDPIPEDFPTKDDGIFSGWYTDAACSQKWVGCMPAHELTLYAGWDIDIYTLTLEPRGGKLTGENTMRVAAGYRPVKDIVPTKEGYLFAGWFTDSNAVSAFSGIMPYNDLTLYAGWVKGSVNGTYTFENGEATLVEYRLVANENTAVYLAETINGVPLTAIAANAFNGQGITSLHLPSALTKLDPKSFEGMNRLTGIYVNKANPALKSVGGVLFSSDGKTLIRYPADRDSSYTVPNGVEAIADYAFSGAKLNEAVLNRELTSIGTSAFEGSDFEAIVFPESLRSIGEYAFRSCESLTLAMAEGEIGNIGSNAFWGCNGFLSMYGPIGAGALEGYAQSHSILYNYYMLTLKRGDIQTQRLVQAGSELELPTRANVGENHAFTGWYADSACSEPWAEPLMPADHLTLYAGSIQVFDYEVLKDDAGNSYVRLISYNLDEAEAEVPESINGTAVKVIGVGCFGENVTAVQIPACVETIEDGAFAATNATIVAPPGSAAAHWAEAHSLQTVPSSYTLRFDTRGGALLEDMPVEEGTSPTLPIPERSGCEFNGWYRDEGLSEVAAPFVMPSGNTVLYASWNVLDVSLANPGFVYEQVNGKIIVTGIKENVSQLVIPEALNGLPVTEIQPGAFSGCRTLMSVNLPGTIETISEGAFRDCASLKDVTMAEGIVVIASDAFSGCTSMATLDLPDSMRRIESGALADTKIETLALGRDFQLLANDALQGCDHLSSITVDGGNAYYEGVDGVLYDTVDDTLVKYPAAKPGKTYAVRENTYSIGAHAFDGAGNLESIDLPQTIWSLGDGAFEGCLGLLDIPNITSERLTTISKECFKGCSGLIEVAIPGNIHKIDAAAFIGCSNLSRVVIPEEVTQIGTLAFTGNELIIHGRSGSEAQRYAEANGILFMDDDAVLPESITLDKDTINIKKGETAQLVATISPDNSTVVDITWMSDDPGIAYVSAEGLVRGIAGGNTTIYAMTGNKLVATCEVEVDGSIDVEEIRISTGAKTLEVGENFQLKASVLPLNATNPSLEYTSNDESVLTVDSEGNVTAVGVGTAQITVAAVSGINVACKVKVIRYPESVSFEQEENSAVEGNTMQMNAIIEPGDTTERDLTWSSSDNSVATVDQNGLVTCLHQGATTITVETQNGLSANCIVTVDHDWGEPSYTWADDHSTVTATRICVHDSAYVEETVAAIGEITKPATCVEKGETTYTSAAFEDGSFTVQSIIVEDIPMTAHTLSPHARVDSTFTRTGTEAYWTCDVCLKLFSDEKAENEIDAPVTIDRLTQKITADFILPNFLKTIEEEAFSGCTFRAVKVPEGCESIGSLAFSECKNLVQIEIPASVMMIAEDAFKDSDDVFIFCSAGSVAEVYAKTYGLQYGIQEDDVG